MELTSVNNTAFLLDSNNMFLFNSCIPTSKLSTNMKLCCGVGKCCTDPAPPHGPPSITSSATTQTDVDGMLCMKLNRVVCRYSHVILRTSMGLWLKFTRTRLRNALDSYTSLYTCCICLHNKTSIIYTQCKHMLICSACNKDVISRSKKRVCEVCRADVMSWLQVKGVEI